MSSTSNKLGYYFLSKTTSNNYLRKLKNIGNLDYAKPFLNGCSFVYKNEKWNIILEDGTCYFDNTIEGNGYLEFLDCLVKPGNNIIKNYKMGDFFVLTIDFKKFIGLYENFLTTQLVNFDEYLKPERIESWKDISSTPEIVYFIISEKNLAWGIGSGYYITEDVGFLSENTIPVKFFDTGWVYCNPKNDESKGEGAIEKNLKFSKNTINGAFTEAYSFSGGLAKVVLEDKTGFIDINGDFIIKPQFYEAKSFQNGFAPVCFKIKYDENEFIKWNLINKRGIHLFQKNYLKVGVLGSNQFLVLDYEKPVYPKKGYYVYKVININEKTLRAISLNDISEYLNIIEYGINRSNLDDYISVDDFTENQGLFTYDFLGVIHPYIEAQLYFKLGFRNNNIHKFSIKPLFKPLSICNQFNRHQFNPPVLNALLNSPKKSIEEKPFRFEFDTSPIVQTELQFDLILENEDEYSADEELDRGLNRLYNDEIDSWGDDWDID